MKSGVKREIEDFPFADIYPPATSHRAGIKADHIFLWIWDHVPRHGGVRPADDRRHAEELRWTIITSVSRLSVARDARRSATRNTSKCCCARRCVTWRASRRPRLVPEADALIEEHGLLNRILRQRTGDDETAAIGRLGEAIRAVQDFTEIPKMIAQALADGLSLEGAGEALSIGAAGLFLRSLTGNPMDVHLHTSANLRRYLLRLDGLSMQQQAAAAADLAYRARKSSRRSSAWSRRRSRIWQRSRRCRTRSQEELLDAITQSIYNQPPTDWSQVTNLGLMRAVPEVKHTVNLAQQYMNLRLRSEGADRPSGPDRLPRQFHRDARLQASQGGHGRILQHARAVAVDAPGVRLPGGGDLVRQEHGGLRGSAGTDARRIGRSTTAGADRARRAALTERMERWRGQSPPSVFRAVLTGGGPYGAEAPSHLVISAAGTPTRSGERRGYGWQRRCKVRGREPRCQPADRRC